MRIPSDESSASTQKFSSTMSGILEEPDKAQIVTDLTLAEFRKYSLDQQAMERQRIKVNEFFTYDRGGRNCVLGETQR